MPPWEQPGCNRQAEHSDAAGGQNRPSAAAAPESGDATLLLDPLALSLAAPNAASFGASEPLTVASGAAPAVAGPLDAVLAAEVLQRVAWGGDRRRGVARLELAGELAGAVIVVRGEGREVALELSLPSGCSASGLAERLSARLAARGLVVREIVVR